MPSRSVRKVDIDAELLAKARDAMTSAAPVADAEVVERALRLYLGRRALEHAQSVSELSEEEAMRIANEELHAMRKERRSAA
jgi:DNA-directed RNA polymerase subunit F